MDGARRAGCDLRSELAAAPPPTSSALSVPPRYFLLCQRGMKKLSATLHFGNEYENDVLIIIKGSVGTVAGNENRPRRVATVEDNARIITLLAGDKPCALIEF
ncbi:hypothetical protein EVAR_51598_1 [Eumeta japonica]|uniref:Uncharacterized protein n=1 Tax=Eumeta variegata TaxID=151549 RepID=A0A4C1YE66_EUMVA|nr:hypothetical protein EVAR_51598_1 [Eumeta japonica]